MNDHVAKKVQRSLRGVFGLDKLRPLQRSVIDKVLGGSDVLAIMPTGAGKSLCYQLPGLHLDGMTVVITPLISLMKDQADKLEELGLDASSLNSALPVSEQNEAIENVENEDSDFIFTTPERLTSGDLIDVLKDTLVSLVVVDEAHCISQWGHDFRPAFLEIKDALERLGRPQVLALTATATPEVVDDIRKQLGRTKMEIVRGGVYRENLYFSVLHTTSDSEKSSKLLKILEKTRGSKIVYCATVKAAEEVAGVIREAGIDCGLYHGKLPPNARSEMQDTFMSGGTKTIVATNAFGMGVDKSNIRAVIHWQIPGSLEAYYQEAGRAGRDGKRADCILLYDTRDRRIQQFFLGGRYPDAGDVSLIYDTLLATPDGDRSLDRLATATEGKLSATKLKVGCKILTDNKIIRKRRDGSIDLISDTIDADKVAGLTADYAERGETDRKKLEQMMLYAQSGACRWQAFDAYFESGEEVAHCGHCDNCLHPPEKRLDISVPEPGPSKAEIDEIIKQLPKSDAPLEKGDIVRVRKLGTGKVAEVVDDKVRVKLESGETKLIKRDFVKRIKK
jgi:ATP-dependent DNA helicase RecQ